MVKCGRRREVSGKRRTCPLERGHPGDCVPVRMLKDQLKFAELDRLMFEHMDSACDVCPAAVAGGRPDRCSWAEGIITTTAALSRRMSADGVQELDGRDEDALRKAAGL